jgi:hypothetical protein
MKRALFGTLVVAPAVAAFAFGADSGLKVGENVSPFHPKHISGPLANSTNCFPCTFQNRPQVQVWVSGDDMKNLAPIAKSLNAAMEKHGDFKALIVFVANGNADKLEAQLKEASKMPGMGKVGMAIVDKADGSVKDYKINLNGDVKNTVFVYKNWKVAQKFVNLKGDEKGLQELNGAIASVVK